MLKKKNKKIYYILVAGSFFALAGFFVVSGQIYNFLFSRQLVLSGVSEKIYAPRTMEQTNNDPLITKAGDYYQSFVRNYTPVVGAGNPKVIFFGDFTDVASKDVWQRLMALKEKQDFTLAWKNFPSSVSDTARQAGLAALCAGVQNKFLDYADLMFKNQDDLSAATLRSLAKKIGLDAAIFDTCLSNENMLQLWGQDLEDGQNLMIDQAPYLFIGNSRVENGQMNELEKIMEQER
ncbi:MAG: thioredoxin domain-containing protein [Patescibacteria group bacterium]|nr:thioredoxin domain-containing protein [Patescibacteria group bacterium]